MDEPITGPVADLTPNLMRHDREYTYIGILLSLWFSGLGIYLLPIGTGSISTLDPSTQKLLALTMVLGTTLCLAGSAMGPGQDLMICKPAKWFLNKVQKHYAPLALRHCYRFDVAGLFACCISLAFFSLVVLSAGNIVGSFTGLMSPILLVCWYRKGKFLWCEANRMDADYRDLAKRIEDDGHEN